jgi:hypothetical protein
MVKSYAFINFVHNKLDVCNKGVLRYKIQMLTYINCTTQYNFISQIWIKTLFLKTKLYYLCCWSISQ